MFHGGPSPRSSRDAAGRVSLDAAGASAAALGGYLSVRVLFQGEGLDRLRDRRHAELVEILIHLLRELGWEVATEVSFNNFGERGSIDILAFHPATRTLLVIEVKTVVPDLGGMLATLDRKVRLALEIARERGWDAVGSHGSSCCPRTAPLGGASASIRRRSRTPSRLGTSR